MTAAMEPRQKPKSLALISVRVDGTPIQKRCPFCRHLPRARQTCQEKLMALDVGSGKHCFLVGGRNTIHTNSYIAMKAVF